jgi:hypothetical protein
MNLDQIIAKIQAGIMPDLSEIRLLLASYRDTVADNAEMSLRASNLLEEIAKLEAKLGDTEQSADYGQDQPETN